MEHHLGRATVSLLVLSPSSPKKKKIYIYKSKNNINKLRQS